MSALVYNKLIKHRARDSKALCISQHETRNSQARPQLKCPRRDKRVAGRRPQRGSEPPQTGKPASGRSQVLGSRVDFCRWRSRKL